MKAIYIKYISEYLQVKDWQVENCAALFEEGCTIPFISRYRKERTGGLDDEQVAGIRHWTDVFAEMEKRKASILATIASQALPPSARMARPVSAARWLGAATTPRLECAGLNMPGS